MNSKRWCVMTKSRALAVMAVISLLTGIGGALYTQGPRPRADLALQDALVTELRALRADIGQIARTSIRTQLLVARLQLQEQRILTVDRQLMEVQNLLPTVRQELTAEQTRAKQFEEMASQTPDEAERRAIQQQIPMVKAQLGQKQRQEQELRVQEAELATTVTGEQARWSDLSDRLDELERSLAAPR